MGEDNCVFCAVHLNIGWMTGIEPATSGTTNLRSNRLSYTHHVDPFFFSSEEKRLTGAGT